MKLLEISNSVKKLGLVTSLHRQLQSAPNQALALLMRRSQFNDRTEPTTIVIS